jgi:hypothetical protein
LNERELFAQAVGVALGITGTIEEFGVSRTFECRLFGRLGRVGTNGSFYWVDVDLAWEMPTDVGIMWAPIKGYKRAKLFELDEGPPETGDRAFDEIYVVVGIGSAGNDFARTVSPEVRGALVAWADVRPDVRWLDGQLRATPPY